MNRNPQNSQNSQNPQNQSSFDDDSGPLPFGTFERLNPQDSPESGDRALAAFLKAHQPIAPPEPANFEAELMAKIAQEPVPLETVRGRNGKRWRTVIGAIAAGIVGAILGNGLGSWTHPAGIRFADSSSEVRTELGADPSLESSTDLSTDSELEQFLESGWDGAIAQTSSSDASPSDFSELDIDEM